MHVNPVLLAYPIGDLPFGGPPDVHVPPSQSTILSDIPSSSTSAPPPLDESILKSASVPIDPLIALMRQMCVFIEQQAHMIVKISLLRDVSERYTVEFAILREVISYVR